MWLPSHRFSRSSRFLNDIAWSYALFNFTPVDREIRKVQIEIGFKPSNNA